MLAGLRLDQMHDEANPVRPAADAALDHVADVEPLAELDRVGGRLLQEAGVGGVQPELAEAHQVGDQLLGQAAGEHVVGVDAGEVLEGEDDDRGTALLRRRASSLGLDRRALKAQHHRGEKDHASQRERRPARASGVPANGAAGGARERGTQAVRGRVPRDGR